MNNNFQPIQLLQNCCDTKKTGHLQIIANHVIWDFYFVEGMLQYASHSLQSLQTVQHYLLLLNHRAIAKTLSTVAQNLAHNAQFIPTIINQFITQNSLTPTEIKSLTVELIKDALESFLWLNQAHHYWKDKEQSYSSHNTIINNNNLFPIPPILNTLVTRMKEWKTLTPVIISPYQRLFCSNPSLIQKKLPSGNLNPANLEKLIKLMQGKTLRHISLFLKQDELKVAQLLFPYVQHNILQLQSPQPPLNQLPTISHSTINPQTSQKPIKIEPVVKFDKSQTKQQEKIYKVVCIDDSPTILDMIKTYLEGDQYEVVTIDNPTNSLPCLFKHKPDIILMDFSMPGMNGNKLCRILKASSLFDKTPIIMISGNQKMLNTENMEQTRATDYLAKPFTKEALIAMIDKYILLEEKSASLSSM